LLAVLCVTTTLPSLAQTTPDVQTASAILSRASVQLAKTQTVRFDLTIEGDTYIDTMRTLKLLDAKGELVRPDRVRTEFKVEALGRATVTIQLIIIGESWWTTDLITGKWGPAPAEFEYDPSILFDNQGGIGPVMDRVNDAVRLDDEKIRKRATYHIQAKVDESIIDPLTAHTLEGSPITVDLWIDKETDDLLRARLAEPPKTGPDKPAIWTLDLFDHDAAFTIDPPT
jgi:hypothetical protein